MVEVVTRSELRALLPVLQRFTDRARRSMDDRLRRLEESDDPLDEREAMPLVHIVAHQSALKDGELLKIPQYAS